MKSSGTTSSSHRLLAIDCARGIALVGMVVFHVTWDLHYFGFSAVDPNVDRGFHLLGHTVAGTFLFVSGFSLVLAAQAGATLADEATRLLTVGAAALAITLTSWILAPAQTILFGILHCVVITNGVALVLRRSPMSVLVALAVIGLDLPHALGGITFGSTWSWLGLSDIEPDTLDFRPFFPWIGPVLLGVAAARTTLPRHLARWRPAGPMARWIGKAGRRSLSIYLVHQPVAFAALYLLASDVGIKGTTDVTLSNATEAATFLRQCTASCVDRGKEPQFCRSACHCVMTQLLNGRDSGHTTFNGPDVENGSVRRSSKTCLSEDRRPASPAR